MRTLLMLSVLICTAAGGCYGLHTGDGIVRMESDGESQVFSSKKHQVTYDTPYDTCPDLTVTVPRGKLTIWEQTPEGFVFQLEPGEPGTVIKWKVSGPCPRDPQPKNLLAVAVDFDHPENTKVLDANCREIDDESQNSTGSVQVGGRDKPPPVGRIQLTDGRFRPVFRDARGQYYLNDNGDRDYEPWCNLGNVPEAPELALLQGNWEIVSGPLFII
ncbi:MAG TPA: hypothetical protein VKS79_02985 [Gemmataceae bacterium]|nr:hypothetical protein [Gemmataceae bacterium]